MLWTVTKHFSSLDSGRVNRQPSKNWSVAYVAKGLSIAELEAFEEHLVECPDCVRYLDSYRTTIQLSRTALLSPDAPVPAEVPESLVEAILAARSARTS